VLHRPLAVFLLSAVSLTLHAATVRATKAARATSADRLWTIVPATDVTLTMAEASSLHEVVTSTRRTTENPLYQLDLERLDRLVRNAPVKKLLAARTDNAPVITLPMPDGTFEHFAVTKTLVTDEPLPGLDLFSGVSIDHPARTASIEHTSDGWSAMILEGETKTFVAPAIRGEADLYVSGRAETPQRFHCSVEGSSDVGERRSSDARRGGKGFGGSSRVYRLAMAATGEYTTYFRRPRDSDAEAKQRARTEIAILVARINQVYSSELGIQFVLVPRELDIIYTDPAGDPYTNNADLKLLSENQTNLDSVLGAATYDIGHVLSTAGGGRATVQSACTATKARGETGTSQPTSDSFYIDYVAHEIGHQFGANHTFNGTSEFCGNGNRNAATAYEPGSGTTIMSYAGICEGENIAKHSSDYFHAISLEEITAHITGAGACVAATPNGDHAPQVAFTTPSHAAVPAATPFVLKASGSDLDGDALMFSFEQFDLGNASPPSDDSGGMLRPMFRSALLSTPERTLPAIPNLTGGIPATVSFESLPSRVSAISFRVVARDQRGGFTSTDTTLDLVKTSGPFQITLPTAGSAWRSGQSQTVTWLPANTDQPPISCSNVAISISTDGGATFKTLLASTANNGSATVVAPSISSAARAIVRVDGVGQAFFAATPTFSLQP
jgi:hypothetical protein